MREASYYRERAEHVRHLADVMGQKELADTLRGIDADYDEIAGDPETGAAPARRAERQRG